jgi:hypothetical protein
MTWDIFLAHSGPDREQAERLFELLPRSEFSVFLDSKCLPIGTDWDTELPKIQRASRITVALISAHTDDAHYLRDEIAAAIAQSRRHPEGHQIIPVYLEDTAPHYGLNVKHGLSVSQEGSLENVAAKLILHLRKMLVDAPQLPRGDSPTVSSIDLPTGSVASFCADDEAPSADCRRFQALLDFSYLFICLDQLESGAWGASVAFWMREVGKNTPGFRLQKEMATEGGIETTAFCAQALASFWPGQNISNRSWASKCRSYFRQRQKADGSFGYERLTVRDFQREIASTCRHTSQAILALMSLSDQSVDLLNSAFRFLFDALFSESSDDPSIVAKSAGKEEKYPAMMISALVLSLQLVDQQGPWIANMKEFQQFGKNRRVLLESLAFLDKDYNPFFTPYGRFEEMLWYSFLSVLNLLSSQDLHCIKNRVNDGIGRLLDESEAYGGLRFWEKAETADYGLTALFLKVLSTSAVSKMLDPSTFNRAEAARDRLFHWLLDNFDKYNTSPGIFLYTCSGTLGQVVWQPKCRHIDCSSIRLGELETIARRIKASGLYGPQKRAYMVKEMERCFDGAETDLSAIAQLFEERVLDIEMAF